MKSIKIRVGGVPEHFNLPWHLGIENHFFESKNIEIEWVTFHGGTGEMTKALREEEVDVCILLTEGIIKDIINGNPSKIVGGYINSPLIWGVHTGVQNSLENYDQCFRKRFAISRFGSGSHLMPLVDALSKGKTIETDQFVVVGGLDKALISLRELESDVFYWEKYTTKPYVDQGILRRIGEYHSPWPCFVIAATDTFIETEMNGLAKLLNTIYAINERFMLSLDSISMVSERYKINMEDVKQWFYSTDWAINSELSLKMVENVQYFLKKAGIVLNTVSAEKILLLK